MLTSSCIQVGGGQGRYATFVGDRLVAYKETKIKRVDEVLARLSV